MIWYAMIWLMRYLKATTKVGLIYGNRSKQVEIEGFFDSDYARDKDNSRSTIGYFFTVAGNCLELFHIDEG